MEFAALLMLAMLRMPWHALDLSPADYNQRPARANTSYILPVRLEDTAVNAVVAVVLSRGRGDGCHNHRQKRSQQHHFLQYSPLTLFRTIGGLFF